MMVVFETDEEETTLQGEHHFGGLLPEVGHYIDWQITIHGMHPTPPIPKGRYRIDSVLWQLGSGTVLRVHLVRA
jgi:hypothetical protein